MDGDASQSDAASPSEAGPDAEPQDSSTEAQSEASTETIDWKPCDLITHSGDRRAQCATIPMPLFWDNDDGQTIGIYVKRLIARQQPARAQMWFVQGGPGGSSVDDLASYAEAFSNTHADVDFYLADHRGVGGSDRLGCAQETHGLETAEDIRICGEQISQKWGAKLQGYTTSASSRDILRISEITRSPGQKLLLWGGSYGAYNVIRMLQIAPDKIDGAMIDGIAPIGFSFEDFDKDMNDVGKALFDRCGQDPFCSSKMGADPWATYKSFLQAIADPTFCPAFATSSSPDTRVADFKAIVGSLLYSKWSSESVPAIVYRLQRCSSEDIDAVGHFFGSMSKAGTKAEALGNSFSDGLLYHVGTSELWSTSAPSTAQLEEIYKQAAVAKGISVLLSGAYPTWPRYTPDAFDGAWTSISTPMLMTQGTLDPATPLYKAVQMKDHYHGANQTFLTFTEAGHCVLGQTNVDAYGQDDCATTILDQFINDPHAALDTSCMAQVRRLDFQGDARINNYFWGQDDRWENGTTRSERLESAQDDPALKAIIESIQRSRPKGPLGGPIPRRR